MTALGLDFGTTNSVLASFSGGVVEVIGIDEPPGDWATLGFDKVLPSVIGVADDGQPTFGWAAKRQTAAKLEAVKRLFATEEVVQVGKHTFVVEEAAALLFSHIQRAATAKGIEMQRSVVTIPANSRGLARFRTKLCAGMAGMDVPALINEPTAAAMAHSIDARNDQTVLVFDWGGGTLDVTILETVGGVFIEKASKGIQRLGGIDIDSRLADLVLEQAGRPNGWSDEEMTAFRLDVERAKILLSAQSETNVPLPDGSFQLISRDAFEQVVRPLIEKSREPIDQCLADLGAASANFDHVILVGGTSKIPAVRSFVTDVLGAEPADGVDPMTAVASGAAIASAILSGELDDNDFYVATEHALGTVVLNAAQSAEEFSVLIPRNHKLPAKHTEPYSPVFDNQESILVRVVEGMPGEPIDHEDNVLLKEWVIPIENPGPKEATGFAITYDYDVDGILHVTVEDMRTGATMLRDDVSFGVSKNKAELVKIASRVQTAMDEQSVTVLVTDRTADAELELVDPEIALLVQRARTKIVPFVEQAEAKRIMAIIADLERATSGSAVEELARKLDDTLRKYAYLF